MRAGDAAAVFFLSSELPPLHRGGKKRKIQNMNAHHMRNEFIEVAVFFPISKCLVQRFK